MSKAYEMMCELDHITRMINRVREEMRNIEENLPTIKEIASMELESLYYDSFDIMAKLEGLHDLSYSAIETFVESCRGKHDDIYAYGGWCFKEARTPSGYDFKSRLHEKFYWKMSPDIPF